MELRVGKERRRYVYAPRTKTGGIRATLGYLIGPIVKAGLVRVAAKEISILLAHEELGIVNGVWGCRVDSGIDCDAPGEISQLARACLHANAVVTKRRTRRHGHIETDYRKRRAKLLERQARGVNGHEWRRHGYRAARNLVHSFAANIDGIGSAGFDRHRDIRKLRVHTQQSRLQSRRGILRRNEYFVKTRRG